jgi:hypothetical protein
VSLCGELRHSTVLFRNVAEACARSGTLRMTEPIDRKTQARKRTNPESITVTVSRQGNAIALACWVTLWCNFWRGNTP